MYHEFEAAFVTALRYCILTLEMVGALIIVIAAVRAFICVFRNQHKSRLLLSEGISMALNFLLGSEVLKTIIAPDWKDLGMTCAILLMRAAMTVLLHWEKKIEVREEKMEKPSVPEISSHEKHKDEK